MDRCIKNTKQYGLRLFRQRPAKVTYVAGQKEGLAKTYYPSGNLYTKAKFKDGKTADMKFYYDETPAKTIYLLCGLAGYLLAFLLTYGFLRWKRK